MNEEQPKKSKYNITPEERERRRQRALELAQRRDPVTGKRVFGGNQGGHRPRKKRPTEIWNEKIEKHAEEVWEALFRAMKSNKEMVSLQAIRQIVEISNKETDVTLKEDRSIEGTSTEELIELVSSRLARLAESGKLPFDIELTEDEVVEIGPGELEAGSDEDESQGSGGTSPTDARSGTSPFGRRSTNR